MSLNQDKNIKCTKINDKSYKNKEDIDMLKLQKFCEENEVYHIDGDVRNNTISNLKVISSK